MVLMLLFPQSSGEGSGRVRPVPPGKLPRLIVEVMEAFLDGLKVFQSPRLLVKAVLWSLVVWAWQSLAFWMAFRAFGIDLGYDAALFVNAIVALAVESRRPGVFRDLSCRCCCRLGCLWGFRGSDWGFRLGFHLGGFIPVTSSDSISPGGSGFSLTM